MRIAIAGAGGFARELSWLIEEINRASRRYEFVGYLVSDTKKLGPHDSRDEVLGDFDWLEANPGRVDALALGIGSPQVRLRLGDDLTRRFPSIEWPSLIHPSVRFDERSVSIGRGVVLCAGVIATVNVKFGDFAAINLACTIGHEAIVGRGAVLNPTVNISGGVRVGAGALIGTGAQVLQYVEVGARAVVGAGAVVTKPVAEGMTVVGAPARPLTPKHA